VLLRNGLRVYGGTTGKVGALLVRQLGIEAARRTRNLPGDDYVHG